jgi:hypothetical protein
MPLFTDYQIHQLARFLIEDHGCTLNKDELIEQIGLILENVAGCESLPDTDIQTAMNQIRTAYDELASKNRNSSKSRQ